MTVTSLDSEWNNLAALPMDIIISYSLHPVNLCRKTEVLFLSGVGRSLPYEGEVV